MPNLTKREIIVEITNNLGHRELTQEDVADVIDELFDLISKKLSKGENVVFRKFGQFVVTESAEKVGRNPKKPESSMMIPARSTLKFRPSIELKAEAAKALPYLRQKKG